VIYNQVLLAERVVPNELGLSRWQGEQAVKLGIGYDMAAFQRPHNWINPFRWRRTSLCLWAGYRGQHVRT
jgi:hypothetical protein